MNKNIVIAQDKIREFCERHYIRRLAILARRFAMTLGRKVMSMCWLILSRVIPPAFSSCSKWKKSYPAY